MVMPFFIQMSLCFTTEKQNLNLSVVLEIQAIFIGNLGHDGERYIEDAKFYKHLD